MGKSLSLKKKIRKFIPDRILASLAILFKSPDYDFANISFSQEGEDLILDRIFDQKKYGFYVDIGAHHPFRYSNTFKFYKKGWQGINLDAMPKSMILFDKYRERDINLEKPISEFSGNLTYHIFNETALNTFDSIKANETVLSNEYFKLKEVNLETFTLEKILDDYLPKNTQIDFMSIDVEGLDMQVLKSNKWEKYKPSILLIEILNINTISELKNNEVNLYMETKGYFLYARTVNTFIYKNEI